MTLAGVTSPGDSVTSHCKAIGTKSRENLMKAVLVLSIYCMCFLQRFSFVTVTEYNLLQRFVRVLTRSSCRFCHALQVVCLKRFTKSRGHSLPRTPLATPLNKSSSQSSKLMFLKFVYPSSALGKVRPTVQTNPSRKRSFTRQHREPIETTCLFVHSKYLSSRP